LLTPAMVHYGQTARILEQRQTVLDVAYQAHPERFVRQAPKHLSVSNGGLDQQTAQHRE
jgi:shikimate 5-dehydrogenase